MRIKPLHFVNYVDEPEIYTAETVRGLYYIKHSVTGRYFVSLVLEDSEILIGSLATFDEAVAVAQYDHDTEIEDFIEQD